MLGAGAAAALSLSPGLTHAQSGELVVSNRGGDWNDRTARFVETPLVESRGIKIVRALNMEPERRTKLLAERGLPRGERKDTREEASKAMADLTAKGMLVNELSLAETRRMRNKLTRKGQCRGLSAPSS